MSDTPYTTEQLHHFRDRAFLNEQDGLISELARQLLAAREVIQKHDLCHNLHGKVDARAFAEGCAAEQRKLYGCAHDADEVATLRSKLLATWSQQDATQPIPHSVQRWVICEIKAALGAENQTIEWQPEAVITNEQLRSRLATAEKSLEAANGLLRDVYAQIGNHRPAEKRHAVTPGVRDSIRDHLAALRPTAEAGKETT
jgi:hypothetical protein